MVRWVSPAAVAVIAAGAVLAFSWSLWVDFEATAWLLLQGPSASESSHARNLKAQETELELFLALPEISPASAGNLAPGMARSVMFRVVGAGDRVTAVAVASAGSPGNAITAANGAAQRLVESWDRRAEERERVRLQEVRTEVEELESRLAGLREQESSWRRAHPELTHASDREALDRELADLSAELKAAERELSYLKGRRDRLAQELDRLEESGPAETLIEEDPQVAASASRLGALSTELADLRLRYTSKHPRVQALEEKIARETEVYASARDRARASAQVRSPFYRRLQEELAGVEAEVAAAEASAAELAERDRRIRERNRRWQGELPALTQELTEITDQQGRIEGRLEPLVRELRELEAGNLRGEGFLPRLRIDRPSTEAERVGVGRAVLASLLTGVIAGFAATVVIAYRSRPGSSIRGARDLAEQLGVPVLAVFPRRR